MRATLIHNPTAGDERPTADDLKQILSEAGFQVRYQSTKKNWKKALQQDSDLVVAAGGDGTIAKVITELSGSDREIGILPIGTANNIARTLGIVGDARETVAGWRMGRWRPFDVGVVSAPDGEHRFVEAAGGGIFAEAMARGASVEESDTLLGNETDRALTLLRAMIREARPRRWRIEIDGEDASGDYLTVEAMNIRHAGPSVPIAPAADPGDGLLDVVAISERDRGPLLDYLDQRLAQHEVTLPDLAVRPGRHIVLRASRTAMRVDDRRLDGSGAEWEIVLKAGAVRVLSI